MDILHQIGHALQMSLGMMWQTGWALVLGFAVSAVLQTVVPAATMREALGGGGAKDIAAATALGADSSSCSYASAAVMRTLFKKGAALSTSLAFMFAFRHRPRSGPRHLCVSASFEPEQYEG